MRPSKFPRSPIRLGVAFLAFVAVASCGVEPDAGPFAPTVQSAKGGGGPAEKDPKVNSVEPDTVPRDTTLTIEVAGSGFDDGSTVEILLGGQPVTTIRTNSTTFVSSRRLLASITLDAGAELALHDVAVTSRGGRKGIGTLLLSVVEKNGNSPSPVPVDVAFEDMTGDMITTDAVGTSYVDGQEGVEATVEGRFVFQVNELKGKNAAQQRNVCFDFSQPVDPDQAPPPFEKVCATAIWNTTDHTTDGFMFDMLVGATTTADSRFIFQVGDVQYWVRFGKKGESASDEDRANDPDRVKITRTGENTWLIDATEGQQAQHESATTKGRFVQESHGLFVMPFRATLTLVN